MFYMYTLKCGIIYIKILEIKLYCIQMLYAPLTIILPIVWEYMDVVFKIGILNAGHMPIFKD